MVWWTTFLWETAIDEPKYWTSAYLQYLVCRRFLAFFMVTWHVQNWVNKWLKMAAYPLYMLCLLITWLVWACTVNEYAMWPYLLSWLTNHFADRQGTQTTWVLFTFQSFIWVLHCHPIRGEHSDVRLMVLLPDTWNLLDEFYHLTEYFGATYNNWWWVSSLHICVSTAGSQPSTLDISVIPEAWHCLNFLTRAYPWAAVTGNLPPTGMCQSILTVILYGVHRSQPYHCYLLSNKLTPI